MYKKFIKRLLDIILSIIAMPVVILMTLIFGVLIYFEDRGSIFYIAKRRGQYGREFNMYKLRSMMINAPDLRNADNSTYSASDDKRVTKIGKILRKTSIDELPQFFNVLIGDMSIIGPRPNQPSKSYCDMTEDEKNRLSVKPGITGYSQAYFRNSINQSTKLEKDLFYANNISFAMDFKIFIQTIKAVLSQKNINIS